MGVERLAASLTRLQDALADAHLPLDVPSVDESRELIEASRHQIEDYVLPRLRRLDAPLLAVVGGSTGAGKSTLVNSLVGRVVSEAGVIRPTTRSSVLVHHPDDARWFESTQILPGLARSDTQVGDPRVLHLVPEPTMPRGLAILDAPDVDSVVEENRVLATQLLGAADLWLFVTSAARYADAVPWQYLRAAAKRNAVVAVVLDRVPSTAMGEVPPHLGQMMTQRGLSSSPLFAIPETNVNTAGLLTDAAVAPIRGWFSDLAQDTVRRNEVVLQTLDGAISSLATGTPALVDAVEDQLMAMATLRSDAEKSFAEAARLVAGQSVDGTLMRGEVLARWQDFVGTGESFRAMEKRIGLFRDRSAHVAKGDPKKAHEVQLAVASGLEVLIRDEGEAATRRAVSAWEAHPAGRQVLAHADALEQVSTDFVESSTRVIGEWQADVLALVSDEGKSKKAAARYLALGANGAGAAVMILVFTQAAGSDGADVGVAKGAAALAQRVLEAIFGDDAVRRMAGQAQKQLDDRVESLMASELARFELLLGQVDIDPSQAELLTVAVNALNLERAQPDRYERAAEFTAPQPPVVASPSERDEVETETASGAALLDTSEEFALASLAAEVTERSPEDFAEAPAVAETETEVELEPQSEDVVPEEPMGEEADGGAFAPRESLAPQSLTEAAPDDSLDAVAPLDAEEAEVLDAPVRTDHPKIPVPKDLAELAAEAVRRPELSAGTPAEHDGSEPDGDGDVEPDGDGANVAEVTQGTPAEQSGESAGEAVAADVEQGHGSESEFSWDEGSVFVEPTETSEPADVVEPAESSDVDDASAIPLTDAITLPEPPRPYLPEESTPSALPAPPMPSLPPANPSGTVLPEPPQPYLAERVIPGEPADEFVPSVEDPGSSFPYGSLNPPQNPPQPPPLPSWPLPPMAESPQMNNEE